MHIPESHHEFLRGNHTAWVNTINRDGSIQATPVWYVFDGEAIRFSVTEERVKIQNLRARPQVTFSVLDPANPWHWVSVQGRAELSVDEGYAFRDSIGEKYGIQAGKFDPPGAVRITVTVLPTRVLAR